MQRITRRQWFASCGVLAACSLGTRAVAAASATWVDRRSYGPFQCTATFPLAEFDGAFRELAALEFELQRTLAVPPTNTPVDVLLFGDQRQHRQYLAEAYPRVPYRRALYVQSGRQSAVFAYRHEDLAIDLRHECTHALLHSNLAMVPLWLDEGLAEYFEMPLAERAFGHPYLRALTWRMRIGLIHSVESLEQARSLADMGSSEYRSAWAWAHFMLHGPAAAHGALVGFLGDIRRGNPPGQLSERLHEAVPDLHDRMLHHFKHWRR